MKSFPVSIVKCGYPLSEEKVIESVHKALNQMGGLNEIVNPSDTVLLKPNLVNASLSQTGATTNPFVLKGIAEAAKMAGAKKIIIAESSFLGEDTKKAFEVNKLNEYFDSSRVHLVDFKREEYVTVPIETGKVLHRIKLPVSFLEADVIINVPVMKTHDVLPVSLGLKNMKGVLRDTDKRRFHKIGLEQAMIDLNKVVMPDLVFYDGLVGMEGHGPIHGEPANLGVLIASRNILGAELTAANVMGFELNELDYLRKAESDGLGVLTSIDITGDSIESVRRPFKRAGIVYDNLNKYGIRVFDNMACSGCRSTLNSLILGNPEVFEAIKDYTICLGSLPENTPKGKLLLVGSCLRYYKDHGLYVPGCSPTQISIINTIKRKKTLTMV